MFQANNILNAVLTPREKSRISNFTVDCYFKAAKLYLIPCYMVDDIFSWILRTFALNVLVKHASKLFL